MSLRLDTPIQPVLPLPRDTALWQRYCSLISDVAARWQIYLHQLGSEALIDWLQVELQVPVQLWPEAEPFDIWQVVNGLALTLGQSPGQSPEQSTGQSFEQVQRQQRLVVVLSEAVDAAELRVPQEWVDMADWAGDYYLAAFVDVDEQHLALWGYATYNQIKEKGNYDADERMYCIRDTDLVEDFSAFLVAQQLLQSAEAAALAHDSVDARITDRTNDQETLAAVSVLQSENLLERLATAPDPRLEIPFEQWSTLISDSHWRKRFYQRRQGLTDSDLLSRGLVDLGQWISNQFEQGWQSVDLLRSQTPALRFRAAAANDSVIRGKSFSFETTGQTVTVVLVVTLAVEADGRRNIRIALYPDDGALLPTAVELALVVPEMMSDGDARVAAQTDGRNREIEQINALMDSAKPVQVVRAGAQDNYIQLPAFRCPASRPFQVRVILKGNSVQTDFVS